MRNVMARFSKLAPAALLAAGFLIAGGARAQQQQLRGCYQGNPLMKCDLATCIELDDLVHAPDSCSSRTDPLSGCNGITGCFNLRQARARWLRCYETRSHLNQVCWDGGDFDHQNEAAIAIKKVAECDAKIKLPTTQGGCGDPCTP
jgi:hypothetical protein